MSDTENKVFMKLQFLIICNYKENLIKKLNEKHINIYNTEFVFNNIAILWIKKFAANYYNNWCKGKICLK